MGSMSCGLPSMATEQQTKRPLPHAIGTGAESGGETGFGATWSVRQPRKGISRLASTLGWPFWQVVGPPRWWLSGDADASRLDRCGEDADRPFLHGLTEQLRPPASANVELNPAQEWGYKRGMIASSIAVNRCHICIL